MTIKAFSATAPMISSQIRILAVRYLTTARIAVVNQWLRAEDS